MQARGRRGSRSFVFGIHRLIAFAIIQLFLNVRGQRHLTQPIQDLIKNPFIGEPKYASAHLAFRLDRGPQFLTEDDDRARLQLLAGFDQGFPTVIAQIFEKQHFGFGPGILFYSEQTGRNDSCIVQYQRIAGL
ncbi:hypothetical protein D3C74_305320 [compost metagenome]